MKKIFLMTALVTGLTTAVTAQEVIKKNKEGKGQTEKYNKNKADHKMKTPEERAQKSVDHLNKAVDLTDDQKTKIYDLALNRAKKVDAVKEKYKGQQGSKEAAKGEIVAIKKEYRKGVKGVLTPDQLEKLKAKAADAGTGQGQAKEKGEKGAKDDKGLKGDKGEKGSKEEEDIKTIGDED